MGWPIAVLERLPDGWSYVELPDGYRGYVIDNSLTFVPSDSIAYWNEAPRVIATNVLPYMAYDSTGVAVSDIVQGDILIGVSCDSINTDVMLPDGRRAIIPSSICVAVDRWERNVAFAERVLDTARSLIGIPYLWGGVTAKGMDCSGLTRLAYLSEGIMLPRDASQQALAGIEIQPEDVADGDLLFFASEKTGRINHVALYAGNDMMIESAGRVRLSAVQWAKVVSIRRVII